MEAKKTWKKRTGFTFSRWVQLQMLVEMYKVHTEIA